MRNGRGASVALMAGALLLLSAGCLSATDGTRQTQARYRDITPVENGKLYELYKA
jgi:hypothetical protein